MQNNFPTMNWHLKWKSNIASYAQRHLIKEVMLEFIQAEQVLETTSDALQYCLKFTNKYSLGGH